MPADDATAGFATFFRQFLKVADVIGRAAHEGGATETTDVLKAWKRAHDTLRKKHLRLLMHEIAVAEGLIPEAEEGDGGRRMGTTEEITPRELIEAYLYGDLIHWGHTHPKLKEWSETPQGAAEMEFEMRNDAHLLAHFYAGFADVVRRFQ